MLAEIKRLRLDDIQVEFAMNMSITVRVIMGRCRIRCVGRVTYGWRTTPKDGNVARGGRMIEGVYGDLI